MRRRASTTRLVLAGTLAAGLLAASEATAGAVNSRTGTVGKFAGVDAIIESCTSSQAYVTVPSMTRTFTQGSPGDEVVVTFQGSASLSGESFDTGFVRLQIDGSTQEPGDVPLVGLDERGTHGFTWQTRSLSPGSHTARIQWRTDLGSSFCLDARSLVVLHR